MQQANTVQMLSPGGLVAGRFRVGPVVGSGGMGIVYHATDEREGGAVALKILNREGREHLARFEREALLLARLRHPGIVAYIDHGITRDDAPFLAMEWLDGEDLAARLAQGPLPVEEVLRLALALAEALAFAHEAGVVHRDLKPQNIFLARDGVKILDFGLARAIAPEIHLTQTGAMLGTPAYMAPEQIRHGAADARVDVFALGSVLHECLTGTPLFGAPSFEATLAAVLSVEPAWLPAIRGEVPDSLAAIIQKLLSKDPGERPASGAEVLTLLRALPVRGASAARREVSAVRKLPCSAWLAWGFLADSDRWDRILGAPLSAYTIEDFAGQPTRVGSAALFGLPSRWIEVGEWVEGQWGYGERRLLGGPLQVLGYRVDVRDLDGGCEVHFRAYAVVTPLAPEGALDLIVGRFERKLTAYLDALDALLSSTPSLPGPEGGSACEAAQRLLLERGPLPVLTGKRAEAAGSIFEERAAALLARGLGRASELLVNHLREAPDEQVKRLQHEELATLFGLSPREVLRALLQATREGLLDLSWEARCPACRVATHTPPSLSSGEGSCRLCRLNFSLDLAINLDVTFRPAAGVRAVSGQLYCGGSPAMRPHLIAQFTLAPGEQRSVDGLPESTLLVRAAQGAEASDFPPGSAAIFDGERWRVASGADGPRRLENQGQRSLLVMIERPPREVTEPSTLLSCPELGALLPSWAPELQVGASTLVLLGIEVAGLDDLLETQGDAMALRHLRARTEAITERVQRLGGAILQENGGQILASFGSREAAREAFQALQEEDCEHASRLGLRGVLDDGSALVITRGGRMELFGRMVRGVCRALDRGDPGLAELGRLR